MKKIFKFITPVVLIFSGCNDEKINLLEKDFTNTKVGTVNNNKFVEYKEPEKKVVVEVEKKVIAPIKKVIKPTITVQEKKKHFNDILVPIITNVYTQLEYQYQDAKRGLEANANSDYIKVLKKRYRAKTDEELLQALKPHPISIALAQSAIESAWLTSRFTKQANNIFGVWSFKKDEPRIAASGLRGDKTIYLRKYKTLKQAVEHYYYNLAISKAYKNFREKRVNSNDPYEIVEHLLAYSEKGEVYTEMLKSVIKYNKFDKHDI
ncbi:MAG: glucosaminidase domain-containing protein [Campylobacterota bacterium]|nr:glucosaminidase domain-containing protein [Campylobacterota bacterium]